MNKIISYISLFFLISLTSCAYEPILNNDNYKFSININKISGDKKINKIIIYNLNNLKGNNEIYDLSLNSNKKRNIISKDSSGDPLIFRIEINVKYSVEKDGKNIINKEINRKATYNNITDKFELDNYEKNIINNLSISIADMIIGSISETN